MTDAEALDRLRAYVASHPTQTAAAQAIGCSTSYLSDLLRARRHLSPAILQKLGLERVIRRIPRVKGEV
jgi:plasmid maintenance system antidote protein VapI